MGWIGLTRSAIFFPLFFLVTFTLGIHFKTIGDGGMAVILWFPVNGFAFFIAVQEISWDAWEVIFERLGIGDTTLYDQTERELAPNITISQNFKIVTMVALSVFATGGLGYVVWIHANPELFLNQFVSDAVDWYRPNVLPQLEDIASSFEAAFSR